MKSKSECVQCANRYYLSTDLKCLPVSPLCKAYDPLVGNCTFCYDGYNLVDGKCKIEWFEFESFIFVIYLFNY